MARRRLGFQDGTSVMISAHFASAFRRSSVTSLTPVDADTFDDSHGNAVQLEMIDKASLMQRAAFRKCLKDGIPDLWLF